MKRIIACFLLLSLLLSLCSCRQEEKNVKIELSDKEITVDGSAISKSKSKAVYSACDIVYYREGKGPSYGDGKKEDEHKKSQADAHTVVHITRPGTYEITGKLSLGQIAVDLGAGAKKNPDSVVTLILKGVDITCEVAPAVIFYNVYECGSDEEDTAKKDVETGKAGANVVIADGTENNVSGSYVAEIYEPEVLDEEGEADERETLHKYDGAFYSKMSLNIMGEKKGDGKLNIQAENEGLNSELHLTISGGEINITAGNDGINTNEDGVSVLTVTGGKVNILCNGKTGEGDGIDSNGWIVIKGGEVRSQACSTSQDSGLDSDMGIYLDGGKVLASGNMLDHMAPGKATYAVFSFTEKQTGKNTYSLKNSDSVAVGEYTLENDFAYLVIAGDELLPGDYTFWQGETQLCASKAVTMMNESGERPGDKIAGEKPVQMANTQDSPDVLLLTAGGLNGKNNGAKPSIPEKGQEKKEKPDFGEKKPPSANGSDIPPREEQGSNPPPEVEKEEDPGISHGTESSLPKESTVTFTIEKGENVFYFVRCVS